MYKIVVHKRAVKYLQKLPEPQKNKIKKKLSELAKNPSGSHGVKNMAGEWSGYKRIRTGDIRIIYWLDNEEKIAYIDHIGPRGDVYKS